MELLLELRIVVIQESEDGKKTVCKTCTRKIVNYYRMLAELRQALAGGRALDEAKDSFKRSRPQTPSTASPSSFLSPEPMILLACGWDRELWFGPKPEVRDSRTSRQI